MEAVTVAKRWLRSDHIHGRDVFLISVPLLALLIVTSDLQEFLDHDGARHPPMPYQHGGWAWQSREAFVLNHVLHIALPVLAVLPYLLPPFSLFRPIGRLVSLGYNASLLGILAYAIAFGA